MELMCGYPLKTFGSFWMSVNGFMLKTRDEKTNCRKAKNKIECRFTMPVVIIAGVGRGVYMPDSPHAVITKITRLSDGWIKVNYVNRKTYWKGKKITRRKV